MNGLNVNQKNVSLCYPSTRPDELFLSALCIHIQMVSVDMLSSGISCVCAADIKHTYSSTSTFINTHLYTCTQLLSLSTPSIDVQALLLQGLFQALLHSYKGKWTSKCPKNIEFAFISLFRGVQPPERHLIHHKIWPNLSRNPVLVSWEVSMSLSSADMRHLLESTWLALRTFHHEEIRVWPRSSGDCHSSLIQSFAHLISHSIWFQIKSE